MKPPKWTDELRLGWQGKIDSSIPAAFGFATFCLLLATVLRWGFSFIRTDVPFTPYYPAVVLATVFGGSRTGLATAVVGGLLGAVLSFGDEPVVGPAKIALFAIYLPVSIAVLWGAQHYRSIAAHYRELSGRLADEAAYRKLVIEELEHRLKNKLSTIHAVIHQVLRDQPEVWSRIDHRIRALSATDEFIAKAEGNGSDLKELLLLELSPYGHVRFILDGDPVFLPAQLAVSLALMIHELATNAGKYGAFSVATGVLNVAWTVEKGRLTLRWDESGGPIIGAIGPAGFGTRLLKMALNPFEGKTEIAYLSTGLHCTIKCRMA